MKQNSSERLALELTSLLERIDDYCGVHSENEYVMLTPQVTSYRILDQGLFIRKI